jgi:outer membrane protein
MKNLSLILNIVLLAAVAYLFFDKFSGAKKTSPVTPVVENPVTGEPEAKPLMVVHVNIDSLHAKSIAYQNIIKQFEKKSKDVRASLEAKQKAFEKEYLEAAQKTQAGTLTPKQEQEYQESLQKKQQAIESLQDKASREMEQEENKFNEKFLGDIEHITDSLKAANGYDYILIQGGIASPILSSNSQLDITQTIVDLLNANQK